jgi:hypothetical protein
MTETAFCPPCLSGAARPGAKILGLAAAAMGHPPTSPGAADAMAALERLRATAIRTLHEHVNDHGTCARCGMPWPCDRAQLAAAALEAG